MTDIDHTDAWRGPGKGDMQLILATLAGSSPTAPRTVSHLHSLGIEVRAHRSHAALLAAMDGNGTVVCALDGPLDNAQPASLARPLYGRDNVGVIMFGPPGDTGHQARALLLGADAWLATDAPSSIIAATTYAVFRRLRLARPEAQESEPAAWSLREDGWMLTAPNGHRVRLTRRERELLALLAGQAGQSMSREALAQSLSAGGTKVSPEGVNMLVSRLRAKARLTGMSLPLSSLPGRGYMLGSALATMAES